MVQVDTMLRLMDPSEYDLLRDFLYEAIFIPDGVEPPPRSIVERPELRIYYDGFGTGAADYCIVAEEDGRIVGAVWSRIMNDYGHIDDSTPSLAISLYKDYRGRGLGTELMKAIISLLADKGFERVSLAVQKANYAVKLYRKVGFEVVGENEEEFIMALSMKVSV